MACLKVREPDVLLLQELKGTEFPFEAFRSLIRLMRQVNAAAPRHSLSDARRKIETWRPDYNEQRPYSSLNYLPLANFARIATEMRA